MKITVNELRNGTLIYKNEQVMQVIEFQNKNEFYHLKVMNFGTHKKEEFDIPSNESIERVIPDVLNATLDSIESDTYTFFDFDTYEFYEVDKSAIGNLKWMIKQAPCVLHSYNGKIYHVETKRYVKAKVVKIESGFVPIAVLENKTKIEVNSFVCVGDIIKIDTFSDRYVD